MLGTQRIHNFPHSVFPAQNNKYYVYALCKPSGEVFYIGKGKGGRINNHFKPSNLKVNSPKTGVIKKYGNSIRREILAYFDTEDSAYDFEEYLISYYGLLSEGGTLTNYAKTRYEYSKEFAKNVSSLGHKSRKNKYTDDQILDAYKLYYEQSYSSQEIEDALGISKNYIPYLMSGEKRRDLYEKFYLGGLIKDTRSDSEIQRRRYMRVSDQDILHYHEKHNQGEISIIAAAKQLGVRPRWLSSVFNGAERQYLGLTTEGKQYKPKKYKDVDLVAEIGKRLIAGMNSSEIASDIGISKTHFHRHLKMLKTPKEVKWHIH